MVGRSGIFEGENPFAIARRWLDEARLQEPNDPDAAALATVDADGLPNVRVVLMRGFEPDAFVFYTNYDSAKGHELDGAGKAAFVIHWKSLRRQVRARGSVSRVAPELSEAYYNSRPLESRIGAWASQQSRPLQSRDLLAAEVARLGAELGETPPRPPHWGGYRITPLEIEFWCDGAHRLHDRFRWFRKNPETPWTVERLWP